MLTARDAAFVTLSKIEKDSSYSNLVLADVLKNTGLENRDSVLAHRLVKTVLEHKITIDFNLSLYLKQPLKKLKPQVLTVLRLGACQLLFMDKIPAAAAVNESVKLAKKNGCSFASGLVNAVLRKILAEGLRLPDENDRTKYLSVKYSFPEYLVEKFIAYYGVDISEKIMAASLGAGNIFVRRNSLKKPELTAEYEKCDFPDNCYILKDPGDLRNDPDFNAGLFHVQDLSSQLCCFVLNAGKGETVLDVCASPGGKTATLAEKMENDGKIISCDIHPHRLKLIEDNVRRLGINIVDTVARDATDKNATLPMADKILCDVPCSGFGVTSKKPEIKYKSPEETASLPALQLEILENSSSYLKKGGRMVYSTCTLLPEENIGVVNAFLEEHPDFRLVDIDSAIEGFRDGKTLTVLPHIYGCDGFFISLFERT